MGKVVEITEKKVDKMSSLVEDILLAGGELMHCITKMEDDFYGERRGGGGYGNRSRYGGMTGNRMDDDYDSDDDWREMRDMVGERRRMRNYRR